MRKYLPFVITILIVLVLIFIFTIIRKNNLTNLEQAFNILPVEQTKSERIWRDFKFTEVGYYKELTNPAAIISSDDSGSIYVADMIDMKIRKFNLKGELIELYGKGRGKGPGEFTTLLDLKTDLENKIWALDSRNSRITVFTTSDEFKIIQTDQIPSRIVPIGTDIYMIKDLFGNHYINNTDTSNNSSANFEDIVSNIEPWSLVLESDYSSSGPDESIIVSFYYTNYILKYRNNGTIAFFRQPISPPPLPIINPPTSGNSIKNTISPTSHLQLSASPVIVGDTFHIFVRKREKTDRDGEWPSGFIDVYDLQMGDYLYSYKLPEGPILSAFAISGKYITGIMRETSELKIWKNEIEWHN